MGLNWINVEDYSFHSLLLMERFQLRYMLSNEDKNWRRAMGIALRANPAVRWYIPRRCPECAEIVEAICAQAPDGRDAKEIRQCELAILSSVEDFVTFTTPEVMDKSSDYIYAWDESRLCELCDLSGKRVLDVGSGSGRLAFAAAKIASEVYAIEPVSTLREYLRDQIKLRNIKNIRVADGMADSLPYPDCTFDIVMSGHVVGDDYDAEIRELARVAKKGGLLIDCPGEDPRKRPPNEGLRSRGWQEFYYVSKLGGDVYRYTKAVE